jgi:hypothetical protein
VAGGRGKESERAVKKRKVGRLHATRVGKMFSVLTPTQKRSNEGPRASLFIRRPQMTTTQAVVALVCGVLIVFLLWIVAVVAWS